MGQSFGRIIPRSRGEMGRVHSNTVNYIDDTFFSKEFKHMADLANGRDPGALPKTQLAPFASVDFYVKCACEVRDGQKANFICGRLATWQWSNLRDIATFITPENTYRSTVVRPDGKIIEDISLVPYPRLGEIEPDEEKYIRRGRIVQTPFGKWLMGDTISGIRYRPPPPV